MISCVCRPVENHAVLAVEVFLTRVERLVNHAIFDTDACHCAEALTFDEYLALLVFLRANLVAIVVVSAQVPLAVPAMFLHGLNHRVDALLSAFCFIILFQFATEFNIIATAEYEQTGNHQTLGLCSFSLVLGCLETLVRVP